MIIIVIIMSIIIYMIIIIIMIVILTITITIAVIISHGEIHIILAAGVPPLWANGYVQVWTIMYQLHQWALAAVFQRGHTLLQSDL